MVCDNCKWYRYHPATYWEPEDDECRNKERDIEFCCDEDGNDLKECEYFEEEKC